MGLRVVNGKIQLDSKPKGIDAPSPSQIAERAYDLAIESVYRYIDTNKNYDGELPVSADEMREFMRDAKVTDLKLLRQSVVEPSAIPWWRK
jgi:hypothetical protein